MTEASSELKKLFDAIASLVQSSTAEDYISDEIKLRLYGLYKRCTGGRAADSDALEPAMWNIAAYRKCNAWKKCDDLELDEAMEEYVRVVAMLENSTGSKCRSLYNDSQSGKDFGDSEGTVMQKPVQTKETNIENAVIKSTSEQPRPMLSVAPAKPSIFQKFTGIKPFIPRGELDITFSDLSFALLRCIRPPSPFFEAPMRAALRLEDEIAQTWNEYASTKSHVLPGLSVRSLVDLHLSAKSYPKGSEVIIVPPIGIEGMMDVIQYHGLKIVPVDIGDYTNDPVVHVDVEKVKQKMNKKTVAVLVVHPFGLICMNESEMKALRNAVDDHSTTKSIEIWEDCAECFGGKHGYMGSEYANVHFFSFGMIKTATALGGGICVLNDQVDNNANATMERMKRIQHMMNGQQTGKDFFVKIQKTFLLLIISRNSILMGILVWILDLLKIDYDSIITSAVKGFPSPHSKAGVKLSTCELNEQKRTRARKLVQRLRRSPHPALLSLLHRRLKSKITSVTVMKRIERCAKMKGLFKEDMPSIHIPEGSAGSQHLYWLFPIITIDPDKTCREMKDFGYDIPRGTSQLGCVTKYLIDSEKYSNSCPNTLRMMSQISYLPIASRDMSEVEMRRLVQTFRICAAGQYQFETELRKVDAPSSYSIAVLGFIAAAITILDAYTFQTLLWANFLSKYLLKILLSFSGGLVAIFVILLILRVAVGRDYINCSNSFSRYNSIMFQRPDKPVIDNETPVLSESGASIIDGAQLHAQTYDLDKQDTLALSVCKNDGVDDGKQVLLTGATGFIGSLLLRELLLHREQLSIKGGVVLICRSKSDHSAKQRVQALLSKDMFSFLTKDQRENLVTVIEGDLSCPRLGISLEDYNGICNELNITHVINSAACVNFTEPLARAAESNITSSLQMQGLTKSIKRNRAKYIYLSTAFVHGNKTGSAESPLPQDLFDFGKYDPLELYESMMNTESCASAAMTDLDFPNTYTFSKSICEHLLMRDKRVRTIIIRPCIVGPAVQKPYEGWAGETPSTLIAGACLFLSTYNLWSFRRERAAVIPVDVVCRFIIAKAFDSPTEDRNIATDDHSSGVSSDDSSTHESEHSSEQSYIFTKDPTSDKQTALRPNNCIQDSGNLIYNAAWDFSSPESASFQWYSFACAVLQLGAANNHFGKSTTYLLFILSFKILLAMDLTLKNFRKVHRLLVHWPLALIKDVCECCNLRPRFLRDLEKVMPFLDLPLLFFPFTSATFHFESDLVAPMSFNAERYMFSSVLAAEKFVISLSQRKHRKALVIQPVIKGNRIIMAGKKCPRPISDLLWCMMQPRGNIAIRFIGWIVIKLLRVIASEVTIDIDSFTSIARAVKESQDAAMYKNDSNNKTFVILAPTHRSFLDFIILSFITFHLPELGIPIPSIAAANDFSRIPFLGPLARMAGAFFVKRGKGIADPALQAQVHLLKDRYSDNEPTCIEVFLEGCRSRDRRFVKPKTGFLRCLINTKGNHVIVPIAINYEALPEQSGLANEADGNSRSHLSIVRLFSWFKTVQSRRIDLGRIHVSAASPVLMKECPELDVKKVANAVQMLQRSKVMVSRFHMNACASILDVDVSIVYNSLQALNCNLWSEDEFEDTTLSSPELPSSDTERWTLFLHFGHYYALYLKESHPKWSEWLDGCNEGCHESVLAADENTRVIVKRLQSRLESADEAVEHTLDMLSCKGFLSPSSDHILQYSRNSGCNLPKFLLQAAVSMRSDSISSRNRIEIKSSIQPPVDPIFNANKITHEGQMSSSESFGAWGYKDSGFVVNVGKHGRKSVIMKGDRYEISGRPMPKLIPFLESETNIYVDPLNVALRKVPVISIPRTDLPVEAISKLQEIVATDDSRLSITDIDRARHGTGHSQEDMFMIRSGTLSQIRLPDAVICPEEESEVENLVSLAKAENWCLIPFGGGTNVCHATWCPPKEKDPRLMISVDMRRMNKILAVNEEDSTIHVQAGITGGDLVREMSSRGYTIGHEPDSIEFSTLGGWIATKASGMKQNRYGNIEGIVKEVRVVSSMGKLWQHNASDGASFARVSTGTDLSALMIGSEGSLGIITSAVMKIWPLPKVKEYDSVILHKFDDGIRFMKDISKLGALKPASVRLLDNTQFRLGQAMKSKDSFLGGIKRSCQKFVAGLFTDSLDPNEMVCATITFEGSEPEVKLQAQQIHSLAAKHGGLCAGNEIGRAGYDMTYAIAYIRDFAMTYGFLAESFETFVPWSKVNSLIIATKDRLKREHQERALPGNPIITCRITQLYDEGVCVYFYFCMNFKNVNSPSAVFASIELAAREEIMANGGSLSHHHGIGKHRAPLMDKVNSKNLKEIFMKLKESIDPDNTFGVRNGTYA